ncbi:MAG: phosphoribosylformylglycinamidine synthase subunit PurL [Armatimonadetes bacterium]|nr:phosphoribosylformylglycinamidine synthase subunit PurL [Armatimonadota bacterium]NOG92611.1 phosphoribosylformylglycinamidine synthase subunit PurL [Armatimonadota bacterium]
MPTDAPEQALHHEMGLSDAEYDAILAQLGRTPTLTELGMFGVLWSEHCSYKSSREILKYFANYKSAVEGSGLENAGVLDIGDGIGITFKIESHNHPSAVEPYEGAATGVGGIIRDVLTMGARPIACLDSLRFGDITEQDNVLDRRLFDRVVQGIGGYGNCIGVPTVAGEVTFHRRYNGSPLVNAMCIGQLRLEDLTTASASGPGNAVVYLGSATGKDGIHGATFASDVLGEDSDAKRPNVQIGDPFAGKLLIEATLEALATGAIVAIQDMGAAGLTCSTCEMSAKGGVGMEVDLDRVPTREPGMSAYEIMLSESQERMLAVVRSGREQEVLDIFHKWELPAAVIGRVTDTGRVVVRRNGQVEADVPAQLLTDGCPTLSLDAAQPRSVEEAAHFNPASLPDTQRPAEDLLRMMEHPDVASKRWIYEQYDYSVQTQTSLSPGAADAAVLALRGTRRGLAAKTDGNGRWVYADPYVGGQLAMVEAARNVACTGARPRGATDCLNFGNPNDPNVYYQFREAVRGVADAAEALRIPVLSGNVSFYNETDLGEVLPTPTIGVVGTLEDASFRLPMGLPKEVGYVFLAHPLHQHARQHGLGASHYLRVVHDSEDGAPEPPLLDHEKSLIEFLVAAAESRLLCAAHDISEGGFAVALAEMCLSGSAGVFALVDGDEHMQRHIVGPLFESMLRGNLQPTEEVFASLAGAEHAHGPWSYSDRTDAKLFGEMPGRVLLAMGREAIASRGAERLAALAEDLHVGLLCVGTFSQSFRTFQVVTPSRPLINLDLERLGNAYFGAIPKLMQQA